MRPSFGALCQTFSWSSPSTEIGSSVLTAITVLGAVGAGVVAVFVFYLAAATRARARRAAAQAVPLSDALIATPPFRARIAVLSAEFRISFGYT